MSGRTPIGERPLPGAAVEVLESLHQHRLLSVGQIHLLHTPEKSRRWTQRLVGELAAHGLVRFVRDTGARKLWFVTDDGADAVAALASGADPRRKVITPAQAAGPLRRHTLAVNDAGIAFVAAARRRGDECGALSWRHEVAHPIGRPAGRGRGELLIADALLTYIRVDEAGEATLHYRFLELDRATIPADALARKLTRYARLHRYASAARKGQPAEPDWRAHYPSFPAVHVLLAGGSRAALERRLARVASLAGDDPELAEAPAVSISFALLAELVEHGPFASIFVELSDPERPVSWLGPERASARQGGGG